MGVLEFHFIPEVFPGVKVKVLCRLLEFFDSNLSKLFIELALCTGALLCWFVLLVILKGKC